MADIETIALATRYFAESSAPGTPDSGKAVLYVATDGTLHIIDDAGTDTELGAGGGGGDITTDDAWAAAGDLIVGTGAGAASVLSLGASGTVPRSNGSALAYALPPGHEFSHVEFDSPVAVDATAEASATTIVTAGAVTFDGSTAVLVDFFSPFSRPDNSQFETMTFCLYDGSSSIGRIAVITAWAAANGYTVVRASRRLTPSAAAHTYSIRAFCSVAGGQVGAGAGGSGNNMPGFIRITKA